MTKTPLHPSPDFSEFITDLDHGKINQKLTEELARVVDAVEDTGLVGELTVKLKVKREGKMATVHLDIRTKCPAHPLHATLFYFGVNGELLREDPRQLSLKTLDRPAIKAVNFTKGKDDDNGSN